MYFLCEVSVYICGVMKKLFEYSDKQKLIKFLMILNDGYDNVRSQILLMDLLFIVSKINLFV